MSVEWVDPCTAIRRVSVEWMNPCTTVRRVSVEWVDPCTTVRRVSLEQVVPRYTGVAGESMLHWSSGWIHTALE